MLLTAKLNLLSGMVFGAAAVIVMNQMCSRKCYNKRENPAHPSRHLTEKHSRLPREK